MVEVHILAIDLAKRSFQVCTTGLHDQPRGVGSIQPSAFKGEAGDAVAGAACLHRGDGSMRDESFLGSSGRGAWS
jgi:hypothetical protein